LGADVTRPMKPSRTFFSTLGAVIALIAFLAMPSTAEAHAGHAHATPAATSFDSVPISVDGIDFETRCASSAQHEVFAANAAAPQERPCNGVICCGKTVCAGCVSVILHEVALPQPPLSSSEPVTALMKAAFGIEPLGLKRPPRTFA